MTTQQSLISVEREIPKSKIAFDQQGRSLAWGAKWAGFQIAWQFVVKVARGLIIPKLLAPAEYGLYASLRVPLSYAPYADLGVKYQLSKRLPYELTKGERAFRALQDRGGSWILATSMLLALGIFVASFFQHGPHAWFYRPGLQILALVVIFTRASDFLGVALVSREEFRFSSIGGMIRDTGVLIFAVILMLLFGVIGAVWGMLLGEFLCLVYYLQHVRFQLILFRLREIRNMLQEGIPLLLIGLMDSILMTVDQIFLLKFFPKEQYGIYALGGFVASVMLSLSAPLLSAIQPRVMSLEAEGHRAHVHRVIESSMTLYLLFLIVSLAFAIPCVTVAVRFYLPKYQAGIPTYVLLAGLALVRGPAILLRPYFVSRNQEKLLLRYQGIAVLLAVVLNTLVVLKGGGIASVAAASLCAYAVASGLMCTKFEQQGEGEAWLGKYVILVVAFLGIIGIFVYFRAGHFSGDFMGYAAQVFAAGCLYLLSLGLIALPMYRELREVARPFFSPLPI